MESRIYEIGSWHIQADSDKATCVEFEELKARRLWNQQWAVMDGDRLLFKTPAGIQYEPEAIAEVLAGQLMNPVWIRLPIAPSAPKKKETRRTRTMKYIAYGSNMSREQMAYRCPDAKLLGTGKMIGWTLEFYLHATVEPNREHPNAVVPVAVWEVSPEDLRQLDRYEGYPSYYTRRYVTVTMDDGTKVRGLVYLMSLIREAPPTHEYYNGILHSYEDLNLKPYIRTHLRPALDRSIDRLQLPPTRPIFRLAR